MAYCDLVFVRCFAAELHLLLRASGACFLNGAFVIGDRGNSISRSFGVLDDSRSFVNNSVGKCRIRPGKTHNVFQDQTQFDARKNNSTASRIVSTSKQNEVAGDLFEYGCEDPGEADRCRALCAPAKVLLRQSVCPDRCALNKAPKKAMLWYAFAVSGGIRDGPTERFVYCKFEGSPAVSVHHAANAFKAYALSHHTVNPYYPSRRESMVAVGDKNYMISSARNLVLEDGSVRFVDGKTGDVYQGYVHRDEDNRSLERMCEIVGCDRVEALREKDWYDRHVRIREEMFIPHAVAVRIAERCPAHSATCSGFADCLDDAYVRAKIAALLDQFCRRYQIQ